MRLALTIPVVILAAAESAAPQASSPPAFEAGQPTPGTPPELAPILERAGQYVLEYEEKFQDIAADEKYTQWTRRADTSPTVTAVVGAVPAAGLAVTCSVSDTPQDRGGVALPLSCTRTTKADVVFVRLAGAGPWGSFRDVYEVDGQKVRERDPRLERLFSPRTATSDTTSAPPSGRSTPRPSA